MAKIAKIVQNLDDHVGYAGEDVTVVKKLPNNYYIVKNDKGTEWCCGLEELNFICTKIPSEKTIQKEFNKNVRAVEFTHGTTYCIRIGAGSIAIKSSDLDECYEMYKAKRLGLPVPVRTAYPTIDTKKPTKQ